MNALPGQLELATVIDNSEYFKEFAARHAEDTHKSAGVRLAKMLAQYDDSPSSQLWGDIQRLAREILK